MATYATVSDVQSRIPLQLCTIGPESQPPQSEVENLLTQVSGWMDSALRWKYAVPITDATDLETLRPICADLVAARVWDVIAGQDEGYAKKSERLAKFAKEMFSWEARTGRSLLVLPSTTESDSGEAAVNAPVASFTDPDVETSVPRFFSMGSDQW